MKYSATRRAAKKFSVSRSELRTELRKIKDRLAKAERQIANLKKG